MVVFIALGSNQGNRRQWLERARTALPAAGVMVRRMSVPVTTRPVGMIARALFVNCVVEGETQLLPGVLVRRLLALERKLGRRRQSGEHRPTPRTVDLDLIFYGRKKIDSAQVTAPHPRFSRRPFVLAGLEETKPGLRPPGGALTVTQLRKRAGR